MMVVTLAAIAWSALCLGLLCLGDPKRRRSAEIAAGQPHAAAIRRALAAGAGAPGILLALSGDAAGFLLWLAACAVVGWVLAVAWSRLARSL